MQRVLPVAQKIIILRPLKCFWQTQKQKKNVSIPFSHFHKEFLIRFLDQVDRITYLFKLGEEALKIREISSLKTSLNLFCFNSPNALGTLIGYVGVIYSLFHSGSKRKFWAIISPLHSSQSLSKLPFSEKSKNRN